MTTYKTSEVAAIIGIHPNTVRLYEKLNIEPNLIDEDLPMNENPMGDFIFHFNPKRRQNFFSILVMNTHTKNVNRDL